MANTYFTWTSTWVAQATSVTADVWGGGGGGNSSQAATRGGAGGGGGGYAQDTATDYVVGTSYTVTVGAGGAGGAAGTANDGSDGGTTWMRASTGYATATGGTAGTSDVAEGVGGSGTHGGTLTNGGNGGEGDTGSPYNGGGGGGSGGNGSNGGVGANGSAGGAGGTAGTGSPGGAVGGQGGTSGAGLPGNHPGAGGGGGQGGSYAGGDGAAGRVELTWTPITVSSLSPADNATGVSTTADLQITFSASVTVNTSKNLYVVKPGTPPAAPAVAGTAVWGNSGGNVAVYSPSLPTGLSVGDHVFLAIGKDSVESVTVTQSAGSTGLSDWSKIIEQDDTSNTSSLSLWGAKVLNASYTTAAAVSISDSTFGSESYSVCAFGVSGLINLTTTYVTATGADLGSGSTYDPPSHSIAASEPSLWLTLAAGDATSSFTGTAPTNYTLLGTGYTSEGTGGSWLVAATRSQTASSDDPGTGTCPSDQKAAATVAFRGKPYTLVETVAGSAATGSPGTTISIPIATMDGSTDYAIWIDDGFASAYAGIADNTTWNFTTAAPTTTISATALAGSGTISAATVKTGSTITPTALAGTGTVPTPTVEAFTEPPATPVAGTGVIPTPTISTGSTITPTPVAGTGTVNTPTVTTLTEIPGTPVAGTGTIPTATVGAGSNITATALAGTGTVSSPTTVGGATIPTFTVEAAFGDVWNEASPIWTDISAYVEIDPPVRVSRGNLDPFSRPRPSELGLTLRNDDRRFDPQWAAGPYYGDLLPMTPIRVTATTGATAFPLFRGFVAEWPNRAQLSGHDPTVELVARDGLSILALYGVQGGDSGDAYASTISADDPTVWFRFSDAAGSTEASATGSSATIAGTSDWTFGQTGNTGVIGLTDLAAQWTNDPKAVSVWPTGPGPHSFECWFKWDGTGRVNLWYQKHGPPNIIWIFLESGVVRSFWVAYDGPTRYAMDADNTGGTNLGDNAWHHLVIAMGADSIPIIWVDGVDETNLTQSDGPVPVPVIDPSEHTVRAVTPAVVSVSELAWYDTELSAAQVALHYAALPWAGDTTTERITRILDLLGWPAADRDLDTSTVTMATFAGAATGLDAIFHVVDTEPGVVFVAPDGDFTFRDRTARNTATYAATFQNGPVSTESGYSSGFDDEGFF